MIQIFTDALIGSAFLGAALFVIGYQRWANWRATVMGRHIMSFMIVCMILLGLALVGVVFGRDWFGRDWVRLIAYAALNWIFWWRFYLLWLVQHRKKETHVD